SCARVRPNRRCCRSACTCGSSAIQPAPLFWSACWTTSARLPVSGSRGASTSPSTGPPPIQRRDASTVAPPVLPLPLREGVRGRGSHPDRQIRCPGQRCPVVRPIRGDPPASYWRPCHPPDHHALRGLARPRALVRRRLDR